MIEPPQSIEEERAHIQQALQAHYDREYRAYRTRRIIRAILWWAAVIGGVVGTLAVLMLGG